DARHAAALRKKRSRGRDFHTRRLPRSHQVGSGDVDEADSRREDHGRCPALKGSNRQLIESPAMKATIDPTARVHSDATLGDEVSIGPYCIVGPHVVVADGCKLIAHVRETAHTTIGARTSIYPFASLGTPPQSVHYHGEPTKLVIGADC